MSGVGQAIDRWCAAIGKPAEGLGAARERLRSRDRDGAADAELRKELLDIARNALSLTDAMPRDEEVDRHLRELLASAGLTLIEPRIGEPVDEGLHKPGGRDPAPTQQERFLISKVERRGLRDGHVIMQKAEVRTYD